MSFIGSALALLAAMFKVNFASLTPNERAGLAELESFLLEHGVAQDLIDYELARELDAIQSHGLITA